MFWRSSLSPDSVARLVKSAIVDATLVAEFAIELETPLEFDPALAVAAAAAALAADAALEAPNRLYRDAAWPAPTLPIDIKHPGHEDSNQGYRPGIDEL
jgi:hypothetical protein